MAHPAGEARGDPVQLDFDRRLKLEFHGSKITSDAGLLAYRELDEALGLTTAAGAALSDLRRGRNTRHVLTGLLRQSIFGRLAGYEDVTDISQMARLPSPKWYSRFVSDSTLARFPMVVTGFGPGLSQDGAVIDPKWA